MKIILQLLTLCAISLPAFAASTFEDCKSHFPQGKKPQLLVEKPGKQRELCFDNFAVLHSGQTKTAVYVAERLNKQLLAKEIKRTDKFYEEARLPKAERATLEDYRGSSYDRGHLAPAADMSSDEGMAQSFSLVNIVPQEPGHNQGLWAKSIERPTRQYVERAKGDVYVFTGPIYLKENADSVMTIGKGHVHVPDKLFKLVYDATTHRAWAHVSVNADDARMTKPVSYAELVKLTGIEFLPGIPVKN